MIGMLVILLLKISLVLSADPLPNVGYLASGYDVFRGNPRSSQAGVDPGFRTAIFDFTYEKKATTSDRRYLVPDHTTFRKNVGCTIDFQSDSIQGSKAYKESLEVDATVEGEFGGVSFSASADFKKVHEKTTKYNRRYTSSQSVCTAYDGFLGAYIHPNFSEDFQMGVKSLPSEYNKDAYMRFLEIFGTHYVTQSQMGAKYGIRTSLTESSWKSLLSQHIKVEAAAGYQGLFSVSAKLVTQHEKEQAEEFAKKSEDQKTFTIGSSPPTDGKAETWANQAIKEPMPIKYHLKPISNLFATATLATWRKDNLSIKLNIEKALKEYCAFLKGKEAAICKRLPDDPTAPVIVNSCRFCAKKCGGSYPVDGGAVAKVNAMDALVHPEGCSGPIGKYKAIGPGARFCCEPRDESHLGKGRICLSCGSAYSYFGGRIGKDTDIYDWIDAYDNGCGGDARGRKTLSGWSMCYAEKPLCALCMSCGGEFPDETSVLMGYFAWGLYELKGDRCSGEFVYREKYLGDAGLCCKRMGPGQLPSGKDTHTASTMP